MDNKTTQVAYCPLPELDFSNSVPKVTLPVPTASRNAVEDFLDELEIEAQSHRAVHHPYLTALSTGDLPDPQAALRDFAFHYGCYSKDFTRYLCMTIAKLEVPAHQELLTENFLEESGMVEESKQEILESEGIDMAWIADVPHQELFRRFQNAIGVKQEGDYCIEAEAWRATFLDLLHGADAARAVGAIGLGTEGIVRNLYQPLASACRRHPGLTRQDAIFFELHCLVDDDHAEALRQIAFDVAQTETGRRNLRLGMHQCLVLRATFWDGMHRRALAMETAE